MKEKLLFEDNYRFESYFKAKQFLFERLKNLIYFVINKNKPRPVKPIRFPGIFIYNFCFFLASNEADKI